MKSAQESKNELEAAIRYAENAISSAKQTIESMEFRQEMAKKQHDERTGREQDLLKKLEVMTDKYDRMKGYADKLLEENGDLEERNDELNLQIVEERNRGMEYTKQVEEQKSEIEVLERQLEDANRLVQFHIDREAGFLDQIKELKGA
tara:strand:+ start:353 stop:796 length:444 start_codon:yes stop_codon:yes gene_type:complete